MALSPTSSHGGSGAELASGRTVLTSGDITTTSASFVDATGVTVTITTGAHRCLVTFSATIRDSLAGAALGVDLAIDGTRQGGTFGLLQLANAASNDMNAGFTYLTAVLTAASHTFKVQWKAASGTATMFANTTTAPAVISVVELPLST